jgi:hypothetical protein
MKMKDSIIAWNDLAHGGQVVVVPLSRRAEVARFYCATSGTDKGLNRTEAALYTAMEALRLLVDYELDPKVVDREFSKIDEYRCTEVWDEMVGNVGCGCE